jgi:DNA-directed RNA polymerase II subunit RPB2
MLQSDLCILNGLDKQVRFEMGECKNDNGGYFIIDGKENVLYAKKNLAIICFI